MSDGDVLEKDWAGEDDMSLPPLPKSASATTTSFPRSSTPLHFPRRPATSQGAPSRGMKLGRNTDLPAISKPNNKGKEPVRGDSLNEGVNFANSSWVPYLNGSSNDRTRPASSDGTLNGRNRFRGSLLVAASDALGFRFGRRRPSIRQPQMPTILPGVIEISAARQDEEVEERNRLREMAAQALGLGPLIATQDAQSRDSMTDDDDEEDLAVFDTPEYHRNGYMRNSDSLASIARSPDTSSTSIATPIPQYVVAGRFRSGFVMAHNQSTSTSIAPIPPFPTSVSSLTSFKQSVGMYPKYYPPSSLRIFALSKNWKNRYLILSSPATLVTRGQGPAVSYLHLFKSSNPEEREMERLEINEGSVVFVSEEDVGGRKQVIKVGGADVGAMRKEFIHEEGGHTMWFLQITDQAEAQKWITNIKNSILGQRTVRAGLIPAHTLGNNEPRGDMDVMLSIRTHGFVTSPSPTSPTSPQNTPQGDHSSISSHSGRSQASPLKLANNGAVSALKGLFANSTRPRSASRATSIDSERQTEANEESFTSMGSNLLNLLRSSTPQPDTQSVNTVPSSPATRSNLHFSGPVNLIDCHIDRKILAEQEPIQWATVGPQPQNKGGTNRAISLQALSLQPPPRKRWASVGPSIIPTNQESLVSSQAGANIRHSIESSRPSTDKADTEPLSSPNHLSVFQVGTPEQRPRTPSLQSVSTYASDHGLGIERSSLSTKRSSGTRSARRWSRQGVLPRRLTPPSGPPPTIPPEQGPSRDHPYAMEQPSGPIPPNGSSQQSLAADLPVFSKRTSGSSVYSTSSSQSHGGNTTAANSPNPGSIVIRAPIPLRATVPPPRPAPTSALPPAPTELDKDVIKPSDQNPSSSKTSFRNSVTQRPFRLSMMAPKPPPSTTLPPRPDESEFGGHRRSSSGSGSNIAIQPKKLEPIPASPNPPLSKSLSPFPPPLGPLPPTPAPPLQAPLPILMPDPPMKRTTSLKQRLRILSNPSTGGQPSARLRSYSALGQSAVAPPFLPTSQPPTPIAEKITLFQNDPSFLQMYTPILPSPSPQSMLPPSPEEIPEVTSLLPPPRRGSKHMLETELESPNDVTPPPGDRLPVVIEGEHLSLSRPGSLRSIETASSRHLLDSDIESLKGKSPLSTGRLSLEGTLPSPVQHFSLSQPGSTLSLDALSV